jgi:D-amino-acid dehydrogenase
MSRIVVIGAGVVGLACAHRLLQQGASVTLIDGTSMEGRCSYGNAGGIAVTEIVPPSVTRILWKIPGWLINPLGPLSVRWRHLHRLLPWLVRFARAGRRQEVASIATALASLNGLVYEDLVPLLIELGLADDLHRVGAIVLYSSLAAFEADRWEWDLRTRFGIPWEILTAEQLKTMEPDLSSAFQAGVFLPTWSHVASPKGILAGLQARVIKQNASLVMSKVIGFELSGGRAVSALAQNGQRFAADTFVLATGAWSGGLARSLGDKVPIESERGYNTTIPAPHMQVRHELIFAESKFVVTPLNEGLRVGGAAEFAGLQAPPNFRRAEHLVQLAKNALPGLPVKGGSMWMGNRPATPDSLPVIGPSSLAANVVYAFGHGHLGLTQAASTARLVAQICMHQKPSIDLRPFSARRFAR